MWCTRCPGIYLHNISSFDISNELAYELFKVSDLRELKRKRFLRALFCAGIALLILFFGQLSRMMVFFECKLEVSWMVSKK